MGSEGKSWVSFMSFHARVKRRYRRPVTRSSRRPRGWFRRRGPDVSGPHTAGLTATFSAIYDDRTWTDAIPGMPRSGRGSMYERSLSVVEFVEAGIASGD